MTLPLSTPASVVRRVSLQPSNGSIGLGRGLPGTADSMGESKQLPAPTWEGLARVYWPQYIIVVVSCILLWFSEKVTPYHHVFYHANDLEYWHYSYPLRHDQVPPWAVPLIAVLGPIFVILGFYWTGRIARLEAHHSMLMVVACVATNGLITNFIKVQVGRPRPDFVARCWPDGATPKFHSDGKPDCLENAVDPDEGRKSFPSGHSSWSAAGLGFLMLWLLGKLRCFDGNPHPLRFAASVLPFLGAIWIGLTRIQDYYHHETDVIGGLLLGLTMAYCFYRQLYPGVMSRAAGVLTVMSGHSMRSTSSSPLLLDLDDDESLYGAARV